jgi:hypothetical protein
MFYVFLGSGEQSPHLSQIAEAVGGVCAPPCGMGHSQGCHNRRFWMKITVRTSSGRPPAFAFPPRTRFYPRTGFTVHGCSKNPSARTRCCVHADARRNKKKLYFFWVVVAGLEREKFSVFGIPKIPKLPKFPELHGRSREKKKVFSA